MTKWLSIFLLLMSFEAKPQTSRPVVEKAFLIGNWRSQSTHWEGDDCQFFVSWKLIPTKVSWNPETQHLPISLNAEVKRIASILKEEEKLENRLDLQAIELKRIDFSPEILSAHGKSKEDFSDQWYVHFSYIVQPRDVSEIHLRRRRHAVILLDGTFVQAEKIVPTETRSISKGSGQADFAARNGRISKDSGVSKSNSSIKWRNFGEKTLIQWSPFAEDFPLELGAASVRARSRLSEISTNKFNLNSIQIDKYLPNLPNETIKGSENNWLVSFEYKALNDQQSPVSIRMLLDGRIIK